MSERAKLPYMPALDGLRAVAVIGVILFHGGYLEGGYLGVDLFFVLSGFLITALLMAERDGGSIALGAFWIRRARRLLPALLLTLVAVAGYAALVAARTELPRIRADGFAALLYYANWHGLFADQTYWDLFSTPSPLAHTWSLAIEEQFYVVWPPLVVALLRGEHGRRRLLTVSLVIAIASSIWLAVAFEHGDTSRAYFGSDTRACALAFGAALAAWLNGRFDAPRPVWTHYAAYPAIVVLVAAWMSLGGHDALLYRGGFVGCQLAVVLLLNAVSTPTFWLSRPLSWGPLRWLGKISYGLYLWHWPIFVALNEARTGIDGPSLFAVRVALSIAAASASYYAVELPLRKGAFRGWRLAPIGLAVFVAVGGTLFVTTEPRPAPPRTPRAWLPPDEAERNRSEPLSLLLAGDSVADGLATSMRSMEELGVRVIDGAVAGCGLIEGKYELRFPDGKINRLGGCTAIEKRWADLSGDVALLTIGAPSHGEYHIDGRWIHGCDAAFDQMFQSNAGRAIDALKKSAGRVFVTTMPYVRQSEYGATEDSRTDCLNRRLVAASDAHGAQIIDLQAHVCPDGACVTHQHDVLLRYDGQHFGNEGGEIVAWWLVTRIRAR